MCKINRQFVQDEAAPTPTAAPAPAPVVDSLAPTAPSNLTATAVTTTKRTCRNKLTTTTVVNLSWGASVDNTSVSGYRVYRNGALLTSLTSLSFQDKSTVAGAAYVYAVRAFDAAGNVSGSSNIANIQR